ncbi:MAG: pyridoxamine 5'-phosphate oxidase [Chitinophagaceae bacterium]|nr:pyridoxamine 5'-phosphate oxidase [Chitinophagaceae bacterium]
MDISSIRKDYQLKSLSEEDVAANPFDQFAQWWNEAVKSEIVEVNAMTLATVDQQNRPSARIVLLKDFNASGFVFYTTYESDKGSQIEQNPHACLVFFWKELERQVRIEGICERISTFESDAYFQSRPIGSRIGASASPQSRIIADRSILSEKVSALEKQYPTGEIPRPQHWGGYRLMPISIEFWQGRSNRLHDRIKYLREDGAWSIVRLAP